MITRTLFDLLLELTADNAVTVAEGWGISPTSLSRHRAGKLHRRSVLRSASEYFSQQLNTPVDEAALLEPVDGNTLVAIVLYKRGQRLTRKKDNP